MIKSRGYYFGKYEIVTEKYLGEDFSRRCFIFPGQGAASPGMMKEVYLQSKIIQDKFLVADELAKKNNLPKISDYVLNPNILNKKTLHIVSNLALFTLECALFDVLAYRKVVSRLLTGHSFGEYGALTAAGIISFPDMFDIIYHREIFSPAPNVLGYMIAIKASEAETRNIIGGHEYHISNLNSPEQTVIAVPGDGLEKMKNILADRKIKYTVLEKVPQPYHSPYLVGVRDRIADYIQNKKFAIEAPRIPVYSSVLQRIIDSDNFDSADIRKILTEQVVAPVDFIRQIEAAYGERCYSFLEIGPKNVFAGFVEKILVGKKIKTDFAGGLTFHEGEKKKLTAPENKRKMFSLVSWTIGRITGYEIEKISFEDRFQEDLGIDSIKKADILLTILDESGIEPGEDFNTSEFGSVKDAVRYIETAGDRGSARDKKPRRRNIHFGRFTPTWQEKNLTQTFAAMAATGRQDIFSFDLEDIFNDEENILKKLLSRLEKGPEDYVDKINVVIRSGFQAFDYARSLAFFKFFRTFFGANRNNNFNLFLVSWGESSACLAGYASFLKSLKKEFPQLFFKYISLSAAVDAALLEKIITQEAAEPFGEDVRYVEGQRSVKVMRPAAEAEAGNSLDEEMVLVAVGGAKGITFSLLKNISRKYQPIIYLIGRSAEKDEAVNNNLEELRKDNERATYISADASDKTQLDTRLAEIKKKHGRIDFLINGAGVVAVNFLVKKSDAEIEHEFRNKVLPALNALELAAKYGIVKTINFSSIISAYGSAGQSIYTAANAMVAGFSRGRATVVHWPAWDGIGMTANKATLQKLKEYGAALLAPEKAAELFSLDITSPSLADIFYLDESDDSFLTFPSADLQRYKMLLGIQADKFNLAGTNMLFEKTFDLSKDDYLNDHKVGGHVYVPAATGIAMFFCLANIFFKRAAVLRGIAIKNPIIMKDHPIKCVLAAEGDGNRLELTIKSKLLHFSGLAQASDKKVTDRLELPKIKKEITKDQIYAEYFPERKLDYGKTFQCADKAFIAEDGRRFFQIDNQKLTSIPGLGFYGRVVQWMDASFQALGAGDLGQDEKNNQLMIPTEVSEVRFFAGTAITDKTYVLPDKVETGENFVSGDVRVVNESGQIIIELRGVLLRSATK